MQIRTAYFIKGHLAGDPPILRLCPRQRDSCECFKWLEGTILVTLDGSNRSARKVVLDRASVKHMNCDTEVTARLDEGLTLSRQGLAGGASLAIYNRQDVRRYSLDLREFALSAVGDHPSSAQGEYDDLVIKI